MDDRGDLGLGVRNFGNHKNWSSSNGNASGVVVNRSANSRNSQGRSENYSSFVRAGDAEDIFDGSTEESARLDYYRNQSAATVMTPNSGGKLRDAALEWQRKSTTETRRLVESRQTRNADEVEGIKNMAFERSKGGHELDMTCE